MRHSLIEIMPQTTKAAHKTPFFCNIPLPSYLPPQRPIHAGRKTLILDLDETLVHSSFVPPAHYDMVLKAAAGNDMYSYLYVSFRPSAKEFLYKVCELFEVVIYTASLKNYADFVIDRLDPLGLIAYRLYRENCTITPKGFVKDLSMLGRGLQDVIIVDNTPIAYEFNKENAVPIESWTDKQDDDNLERIFILLKELAHVGDVRHYIMKAWEGGLYNYEKIIAEIKREMNTRVNTRDEGRKIESKRLAHRQSCIFMKYRQNSQKMLVPQTRKSLCELDYNKENTRANEAVKSIRGSGQLIAKSNQLMETIKKHHNQQKVKLEKVVSRKSKRITINVSHPSLVLVNNSESEATTPKNAITPTNPKAWVRKGRTLVANKENYTFETLLNQSKGKNKTMIQRCIIPVKRTLPLL